MKTFVTDRSTDRRTDEAGFIGSEGEFNKLLELIERP